MSTFAFLLVSLAVSRQNPGLSTPHHQCQVSMPSPTSSPDRRRSDGGPSCVGLAVPVVGLFILSYGSPKLILDGSCVGQEGFCRLSLCSCVAETAKAAKANTASAKTDAAIDFLDIITPTVE